jgi:hypothetical protein
MNDEFGLEAELAIMTSGVRDVFTPNRPVNDVDLLFGRSTEVKAIIQQINTPGQHALLFGERGVGKSSLANIASELILRIVAEGLYKSRCDSTSTFETIVRSPLLAVGVDLDLVEHSDTDSTARTSGAKLQVIEKSGTQQTGGSRTYRPLSPISPARAAELLSRLTGLLVVDEVDAVVADEKKKLAELIKLLSDSDSKLKVMLVGISDTAQALTAGHPSVLRCLKETRVSRMTDGALRSLVIGGADRLGLRFTDPAIAAIVKASSGYPHFTHLLALKAAESAIVEHRTEVDKEDVKLAMSAAMTDAEGSLRNSYEDSVRSSATNMYQKIVLAASNLTRVDRLEFKAPEWREEISRLTGEDITQGSLNNYLQRLVSEDASRIFVRLGKGVYRFTDPRMPSLVKIANGVID